MEIKTVQRFIRTSPYKLRLVVNLIKGLSPRESLEALPFTGKRAAEPLSKAIKVALANAKDQGISESDLVFKEIQINEGPRLKRGRPVSRGRWHPYKRRMSHIRIVLETKEPEPIKEARKKIKDSKKEQSASKKVRDSSAKKSVIKNVRKSLGSKIRQKKKAKK
jgi:large subunit ribosomal protein L22